MTAKTEIVDVLGEKALVLPALLQTALVANERAKYVLGVLQMAKSHADQPDRPVISLQVDREACGIADASLDRAAARSEGDGTGGYIIPSADRLFSILDQSLRAMLAPLAAAASLSPTERQEFDRQRRRLDTLIAARPAIDHDVVSADTIAVTTSGDPPGGDGIHLLIMDLHKAIDRLQAAIATEEIAGAKAFGIADPDRRLIAAFMAGVNRTAPLKFNHPGLETIAVRSGDALLIQNDIGATTAHVLVIRVSGLTVRVTYTDTHAQRARFFQNLFEGSGMDWEEWNTERNTRIKDVDLFYMLRGSFAAADEAALAAFLERLGSRIVFLIDWNKARKRLALLVPNDDAVAVLNWAAAREFGHRGFLELGAEKLIYNALEWAAKTPLRYGEPLHDIIGTKETADFLRFVLETTASGLLKHRSEALIRDEIRAELLNHFRSAEERLLAEVGSHATIMVTLATGLRSAIRQWVGGEAEPLSGNAVRAKQAETEADTIVKAVRETAHRIPDTAIFVHLMELADDAADEIEDASFLAGLLPERLGPADLPPSLLTLIDLLADASLTYQHVVEFARKVHRGGARKDMENFLESVDQLVTLEHQTDERDRAATVALLDPRIEARRLFLLSAIARHCESATDSFLHAALVLRDHIFGEVMQR